MRTWTFSAEPLGEAWMPMGHSSDGLEIFIDQTAVSEKRVAVNLANAMMRAYDRGWFDALEMVQSSLKMQPPTKGARL